MTYILSVFQDSDQNWITFGDTEVQARERWEDALFEGKFPKPQYRVVIRRK